MLLGIAGTWLATPLLNQFVFTWPVRPFIALRMIAQCHQWSKSGNGACRNISSRLALLLFASSILLYAAACKHFYIVSGWGFLIGTAPALPILLRETRAIRSGARSTRPLIAIIIAFTVYFWSVAAFLPWQSGVRFD